MEIKSNLPDLASITGGQGANTLSNIQSGLSEAQADSFESKLRSAMTEKNDAALKEACVQFEEVMLSSLYKQMKATVQRSDLMGEDPGRETYEQWQDEAMVKEMAKNGSFGIASLMYRQLSKTMQNAYELIDETPTPQQNGADSIAGAGAIAANRELEGE